MRCPFSSFQMEKNYLGQGVFGIMVSKVGGWYIENSLTTLGQKDPVSEYNSQLWNSGIEEQTKRFLVNRNVGLNYTSNVYIIKDPSNPQNEGQIKLYRYGKKIFDKINDLMNPEFEDESPVNPFDLWEGENFKMKIRKVEGYSNYDKSEFEGPLLLFLMTMIVWKKFGIVNTLSKS